MTTGRINQVSIIGLADEQVKLSRIQPTKRS